MNFMQSGHFMIGFFYDTWMDKFGAFLPISYCLREVFVKQLLKIFQYTTSSWFGKVNKCGSYNFLLHSAKENMLSRFFLHLIPSSICSLLKYIVVIIQIA